MAKLLYAASPQSADMLYATGFQAPDPFLFIEHRGVKTIVLNDLEIDRGRGQARVEEILPFSELAREIGGQPPVGVVAAYLLRRRGVRRVEVPADFPSAWRGFWRRRVSKCRPSTGISGRSVKSKQSPKWPRSAAP